MKLKLYILFLILALLFTNIFASIFEEGEGEGEGEGSEEVEGEKWKKLTSTLCIATLLITLSILFEFAKEYIEESTSEELKPVVEHLFQELTVLGFLSLLTFLLVQFGAAIDNPISVHIFNEAELLSELIEYIHMGLFAILIVFIVEVVLLIRLGEREKKFWEEGEEYATKQQERLLFNYKKSKKGGGQDKLLWRVLPFLNPSVKSEEHMNYFAIRTEFVSPRDETKPRLPRDFSFSNYLSICMGEVLGELVEISPRTWVALELFFIATFFLAFIPNYWALISIYFAFGWFLVFWIGFLAMRLNTIKLKLVPRVNVNTNINEETGLLSGDQFSPPKFLSTKLERRTNIGKLILGPPANKHQKLFWFDTKGPQLLIFMIRLIILLTAIYISGLLVICFATYRIDEYPNWLIGIYVPLAFIPAIIGGFFYTPKVIRLWVTVSNIEMLKNHEVIANVMRIQKTAKSLKTLKVIQLMKFKTRKAGSDIESGPKDLKELPPEKLQSLKEVFELFDVDGSGNIDCSELMSVFETLGQDMTELEARELITELDQDGDGELSFEEFSVYFQEALTMEDEDPDEMIKSMFSIFDRNNDGDISVGEFSAILQKLGSQLTIDDIDAVIDEVDRDGDGNISLEEFEVMVRKHLLEEKKNKRK